jgi:hypothetical protein
MQCTGKLVRPANVQQVSLTQYCLQTHFGGNKAAAEDCGAKHMARFAAEPKKILSAARWPCSDAERDAGACSTSIACKLMEELSTARERKQYRAGGLVPPVGWAESLPWLWYPSGAQQVFLTEKTPASQLLFRGGNLKDGQVSDLAFVAAVYQLDGRYLGLTHLTTQLQVRTPYVTVNVSSRQCCVSTEGTCHA